MTDGAWQRRMLCGVFFLSGAPGLASQLAWTRVLGGALGHEWPALVGVVTAYFLGLACGAWRLDGVVARSRRPAMWYAGLEAFSACWIVLGVVSWRGLADAFLRWAGPEASEGMRLAVGFGLSLLVVGPSAGALGATLPAMERAMRCRGGAGNDGGVGRLYAWNTAGAVMGVACSVGWSMPVLGFRATLLVAAATQGVCAATVAWWVRRHRDTGDGTTSGEGDVRKDGMGPVEGRTEERERSWWVAGGGGAFVLGWLGMGYELFGLRMVAQTTENTVHTYAAALVALLGGTSLGAALAGAGRDRSSGVATAWVAWGMSICVVVEWLASGGHGGLVDAGRRVDWGWTTELGLAAAVFGVPAVGMGFLLARIWEGATSATGGVGRAVAWNALGAALAGPFWLAGVLPSMGSQGTVLLLGAGYWVVGWREWVLGREGARLRGAASGRWAGIGGMGSHHGSRTARWDPEPRGSTTEITEATEGRGFDFLRVLRVLRGEIRFMESHHGSRTAHGDLEPRADSPFAIPHSLRFTGKWGGTVVFGMVAATAIVGPWPREEGLGDGKIRRREEGFQATVSVVETPDGHRTLRVNRHFQQGGTATAAAAARHAHLPLLLHPAPRRALFLGIGTGITMGAAAAHAGLRADGVELLPEVVRALREFEPENGEVARRDGFRVITADARRFARTAREQYDVIVADLFHPAEDGAGFLYTREHFAALRSRLAEGGVICQWLPLHQLELEVFRDVVATFRSVFPGASLWWLRFNVDVPVVGLMAGQDGGDVAVGLETLSRRWDDDGLRERLRPVALTDAVRVLGCRLAGPASLGRLGASGAVATDDLPRVMYRAARTAYAPKRTPWARVSALLAEADPEFERWLERPGDAAWWPRLAGFRTARDRHLYGLCREAEGGRQEAITAYLESAAASADYTGGYAQAIMVASAYARTDPASTRRILESLVRVRPERGLAKEMLERLGRAP